MVFRLHRGVRRARFEREAGRTGELTVIEAQAYFEDYAADFTLAGFKSAKTRGDTEPVITPLWDQSRSFTIDGTPMVEVPLNVLPSYSYRARDSVTVAAMTDKAPNMMIYLLAQKDENEDVTYRVVHIVADSSYLAGDPAKAVEDLSVSKLSDFSGMVVYYDLTGNLLDGVVYSGGRQIGFVSASVGAPPAAAGAGTRGWEPDDNDSDGKYVDNDGGGGYKCERWVDEICQYTYVPSTGTVGPITCKVVSTGPWKCTKIDGTGGDEQDNDKDTDPNGDGDGDTSSSEIFDLSKLTPEQQKKLEQMLKKIMLNCMGGKLYGALETSLNYSPYTILINDFSDESTINFKTGEITLGLFGRGSEVLFHEMIHAYQHTQKGNMSNEEWNSYAINREIEAWCAEYMYLPYEERDIWQQNEIKEMGAAAWYLVEQLNARGEPINDKFEGAMSSLRGALRRNGYSNMAFDANRMPLDNLKNLQELAKDCKTPAELAAESSQ